MCWPVESRALALPTRGRSNRVEATALHRHFRPVLVHLPSAAYLSLSSTVASYSSSPWLHSIFAAYGPRLFFFWYPVAGGLCRRLRALMDYVATVSLKYKRAPDSHRGAEGDGDGCASLLCMTLRRTSDTFPLCPCTGMYSRRSSRPQPRGSGGDVTPRKDTREDQRLYLFNVQGVV